MNIITANFILNLLNITFRTVNVIEFYSCQLTRSELCTIIKQISSEKFFIKTSTHFDGTNFSAYIAEENAIRIVDMSCEFAESLIKAANIADMFITPHKWLLIGNDEVDMKFLAEMNILVDSDVTIATGNNNGVNLKKIYKKDKRNFNLELELFARYIDGRLEVNPSFNRITARRRKNLAGTLLNNCNVITHNETYHHLTDKRQKHIDTITKVNYVFMQYLGDLLNATMNYSFVGTWGYRGDDMRWTGMIGEMTRRHADIGGTPLFFTSDRVRIIDYIAMTTPTKSKFVFRQPKLSYITNVYTLPFNTGVWLASFGIVVVTALGLYVVVKWEWYKKRNDDENNDKDMDPTELQGSAADVAFVAFAAVCQQGASAIPSNSTGRVITILLYTSLMFLYTSYSANIVALLQSSSTSIQTLEDLLRSRLQVGVDDTVFNHFYFPNASEPVRRAIYLQKVAPPGQTPRFFPIEEGVRRLREGLFAFHMEAGAGYKIVGETFMEDEKCGLQEIQFLQVPDPWLAVQKNVSYKEMLKVGLRQLHESGIQHREVTLLYTKKPICASRGSTFIGVAIVDCYPAALVFAVGIAIAFSVFALEIFVHVVIERRAAARRCHRTRRSLTTVAPSSNKLKIAFTK